MNTDPSYLAFLAFAKTVLWVILALGTVWTILMFLLPFYVIAIARRLRNIEYHLKDFKEAYQSYLRLQGITRSGRTQESQIHSTPSKEKEEFTW